MTPGLRSPLTGALLRVDGHALVAGDERWPVVCGIPFLCVDRAALAHAALSALDRDDEHEACALLLRDQDGWAPGPPPSLDDCRALARGWAELSLREAMARLGLGPVATYFTHRWSDPTFLSGLALAEAHWNAPETVFELACGAGHFLRAFAPRARRVIGADLVFAKLWLARRYVAPEAQLLCFDAGAPWPLPDRAADLLFCHDAVYFLPAKTHVAAEMRRVASRALIGHAHNSLVANHSAGAPLPPAEYARLFTAQYVYDDAELARAMVDARPPVPAALDALADAPAISLAAGAASVTPPGRVGTFAVPPSGTRLRRNPLYARTSDGLRVAWPSVRYRDEYATLATYPSASDAPEEAVAGSPEIDARVRRGELLDLPARW